MAINTYKPVARRPALVAIDGVKGTFRRYWPKYPQGFITDLAELSAAPVSADWLRAAVEEFRQKGFTK